MKNKKWLWITIVSIFSVIFCALIILTVVSIMYEYIQLIKLLTTIWISFVAIIVFFCISAIVIAIMRYEMNMRDK